MDTGFNATPNAPGQANTISNWDPSTLTRFIRDILQNQPVLQYPYLLVDTVEVKKLLQVDDQAFFNKQQTFQYIGATGNPGFLNSWVNNGGSYDNAGYVRTIDGFVRLTGVIKTGVIGSAAFVLPPGYRPATLKTLATISNNAIGRVDIDTGGNVIPTAPSSNAWVVLDGLSFQTATKT